MFDLTSSKLLILAVVALIVVGPKDLPALMRTVGRYLGMIRRQANEFRAQFEEAMRESELSDLKKEVEQLGEQARDTLRETGSAVEGHVSGITQEVNESLADIDKPSPPMPNGAAEKGVNSAEETPPQIAHDGHERAVIDSGAIAEAPEPATPTRSGT